MKTIGTVVKTQENCALDDDGEDDENDDVDEMLMMAIMMTVMMPMLMMIMMPIMVMMSDGDFDDNSEDNVDMHGLVLIRCHCHAAEQTLAQSFQTAE